LSLALNFTLVSLARFYVNQIKDDSDVIEYFPICCFKLFRVKAVNSKIPRSHHTRVATQPIHCLSVNSF